MYLCGCLKSNHQQKHTYKKSTNNVLPNILGIMDCWGAVANRSKHAVQHEYSVSSYFTGHIYRFWVLYIIFVKLLSNWFSLIRYFINMILFSIACIAAIQQIYPYFNHRLSSLIPPTLFHLSSFCISTQMPPIYQR